MKWLTDLLKAIFVGWWKKEKPLPIPVPEPTPEPSAPAAQDEIDLAGVVVAHGPAGILSWPINPALKRCWLDNQWRWEWLSPCFWVKEYKGSVGNKWLFLEIDGRWHGQTSDWYVKGKDHENFGDVKMVINDVVVRPSKGQRFGFMLSTPARHLPGNYAAGKDDYRTQVKLCVVE